MKALISADTDEVLGFTVFGTEAAELMAVVQTAMLATLSYTVLRDAILTQPWLSVLLRCSVRSQRDRV
jgi:pyruvate/2-oxoglutarate dehydrogenase complex dihydrolipoamide dehydrogenase (E3) component